jgi:hypothetical protein
VNSRETSVTYHPFVIVWPIVFWGFIAIKAFGHTFAAWSWWWVLLPIVPVLAEIARYYGL